MNFFHVLTLVLVVLKALNLFPYSWWLVFAPSLVSIGFGLVVLVLAVLASVIMAVRS